MNRNEQDPGDLGASDHALSRRMREAAHTVGAGAHLPPASDVRARGRQRRRRRSAGLVAAAALAVVGVVTGTSALLGSPGAPASPATNPPAWSVGVATPSHSTGTAPDVGTPTPSTFGSSTPTSGSSTTTESTPPTDPETSVPSESASMLDGGRSFDLVTPDGQWLAPNVEGGVSVVAQPEPGGVSTSWLVSPVDDGRMRLETVTTADGRPLCLHVLSDGVVGLDVCDDTDPSQLLEVTVSQVADGGALSVTVASGGVFVAVVDGTLTTTTDAARATVFSAVDRGPFVRQTS